MKNTLIWGLIIIAQYMITGCETQAQKEAKQAYEDSLEVAKAEEYLEDSRIKLAAEAGQCLWKIQSVFANYPSYMQTGWKVKVGVNEAGLFDVYVKHELINAKLGDFGGYAYGYGTERVRDFVAFAVVEYSKQTVNSLNILYVNKIGSSQVHEASIANLRSIVNRYGQNGTEALYQLSRSWEPAEQLDENAFFNNNDILHSYWMGFDEQGEIAIVGGGKDG